MKKQYYKIVLMPIEVIIGDFCWDSNRICTHFDNKGGHPYCNLKFIPLIPDKAGRVPKPIICLNLPEFSSKEKKE